MSSFIISAEQCSKWYGHILGVSEITWQVKGGVVGLLGPNGSGKSTLMKMIVGLLQPSLGKVLVFGKSSFDDRATRQLIGYCPEHENLYDELTGLEFVTAMATLSGIAPGHAQKAAAAALEQMKLTQVMNRAIRGYSKGMRQRTKLAQALVHDPALLIFDEPLTGVDPVARAEIIECIKDLAKLGKTVVMSSHVLYEIEALTEEIVVIYRGQVLAEGNMYEIRTLIDQHPHRIRVECDEPKRMAQALASADHVVRMIFERQALIVETTDPDFCYTQMADISLEQNLVLRALTSPDNNLGAVFEYLTGGSHT